MMHSSKVVVLVLAIAPSLCPRVAAADTVVVKVSDYENKGVQSRVLYTDGPSLAVLGDTDLQGVLNRDYKCKDGQLIRAHPNDIGTYFESRDAPCAVQMDLKVVKRQTPRGIAINYRVEQLKFNDGSSGVIVYRPFFVTTTSEHSDAAATCEVKLNTVVDQEVFRQDSPSSWTTVQRGEASPSTIGVAMTKPDNQVVLLPFGCNTATSRLQQIQNGTAESVVAAFGKANMATAQSLRVLGLQSVASPQ
jgi:hypothetical protein